ncbi:MAG: phosphodiester glycosidase family protein [Anaerolineales bacterium]|nr:phosphodiester glycosidase family protein [Anaerolineales bacterium]
MKKPLLLSLVVSTIFLIGIFFFARTGQAQNPDVGWQTVAPGIEYQQFYFPASDDLGANDVYVARMARGNPDVTIDSMIAQGRLSGGTEPTSAMATRYEDTLNYWGQSWGKRNNVVVAINGYYFGAPIEPSGVPWRGQIHSGWYAKRHDDNENGSGFVWQLDGDAFIGECVYHQPSEQIVAFSGTTTSTVKIDDINTPRGEDELILYTPQYDLRTPTDDEGVEILVEMTRPTLILPPSFSLLADLPLPFEDWLTLAPQDRDPSAEAVGYVREIRDGAGTTIIPFDHVVLSATGVKRTKLLENLELGEQIGISQAINHLSNEDCETPIIGKDWTKTYASIGGAFYFLEDGLINDYAGEPQAVVRDSRTAIAYNEDYIFFIVVDRIVFGDDPGDPAPDVIVRGGMNMAELGYFAREYVGADFGIAQDGGGSTTMVINGEVVNVPNDWDSDITIVPCPPPPPVDLPENVFLPVIVGAVGSPAPPLLRLTPTPASENPAGGTCYQGTERYVANGMMMVVVEPMTTSTVFTPTQSVVTTQDANLRTGPGTNYPVINTIATGDNGTVLPHLNNLNGVYATGFHWWYVDFGGGNVGWMSETMLAAGGG